LSTPDERSGTAPRTTARDPFGRTDAAAYVVDDLGRITHVNPRAEELLGRTADRLVGQDAHDLLHRDSAGHTMPLSRCTMRQAMLGRHTAQGGSAWFERGDGTLLELAWLVTTLTDDGKGALVLLHEPAPLAEPTVPHGAELSELDRLALLAETTTRLTSTLDVEEALERLMHLVVPRLADWAVVDLITERDEVWRTAVVRHTGNGLAHRADLEGPMPPVPEESPRPLSRALRGAASSLAGPQVYQGPPDSGIAVEQRRLFEATGIHSAVIAPIRGLREILGALTLGRSERPVPYTTADLPLLEDITRRAGLALDNARLYQRQRAVAETMQRHLLPQLPQVPGLRMAARYVPAPDASQVGGDWYDAFQLPDGATALVIGDVVGHDLDAAAGMAQVRNMLRAYAWSQPDPPSRAVERLDQAITRITEVPLATALLARMRRPAGGAGWELCWTNAGHPPPLLVEHDGRTRFLEDAAGMLLGTGTTAPRPDATLDLPPRSTLVLYTDGLVESPRHHIDEGLTRLRQHAAALAHRPLGSFADLLLERVRPEDNDDDVALLTVRGELPE
jgi:PAS domain S-box-containing protein